MNSCYHNLQHGVSSFLFLGGFKPLEAWCLTWYKMEANSKKLCLYAFISINVKVTFGCQWHLWKGWYYTFTLQVTRWYTAVEGIIQSEIPASIESYRNSLYSFRLSSHQFSQIGNFTKVRPLSTLSHKRSDNFHLLIVFKWTLYELCICILRHDFDQLDSVF